MKRTTIIAEAGVNHNGSIDLALDMVNVAAEAGADIVKFQTFNTSRIVSRNLAMAAYQATNIGTAQSQYEMLKALELSHEMHLRIEAECRQSGIQFLSTAFDIDSLHFLLNKMNVRIIKVPSGEITNGPFLLAAARARRPLILSTGMSTLGEVEAALHVLAFGYSNEIENPTPFKLLNAFRLSSVQNDLKQFVSLLHCTTEYPAPFDEINLKSMRNMGEAFGLPYGYSDHTLGIHIPIAATALGATIVEKHFTLNRNLSGPDHKASLEPMELKEMVRRIRETDLALGTGIKMVGAAEEKNRMIARKVVVASRDIAAGELFTAENLSTIRAGSGLSPMELWDLIGRPASRAFLTNEPIVL